MSNHYHPCLETSKSMLLDSMPWLQSSFANQFSNFQAIEVICFRSDTSHSGLKVTRVTECCEPPLPEASTGENTDNR